ncbi:hypothetical protein GCM10020254_56550 [Streptomyces goshikiensis]
MAGAGPAAPAGRARRTYRRRLLIMAAATPTPAIVLIGHGMVGQRYLEALAERGATATHRITVLCEEPRPAYDRVHLTSYFSGSTPEDLSLTPPGFMAEHGIELHLGDPAEAVDREARTVTSRSGRVFPYDVLVLATGSHPLRPARPRQGRARLLRLPHHRGPPRRSRSTRGPAPAAPWSAAASSAWRPRAPSRASDSPPASSSSPRA